MMSSVNEDGREQVNSQNIGEEEIDINSFSLDNDQYLSFQLGDEYFGFNILTVKEIKGWDGTTFVPNSPDYIQGVINLRGAIVPIVDLRICFNIGEPVYLATTVVIIVTGDSERTVGFVVDAVADVLSLQESELIKVSEFQGNIPQKYILGLTNAEDTVATLLDVHKVLEIVG